MDYILLFLEGIITFISPCLLPMLPVYIIYFAGGEGGKTRRTVANAIGFVLGFTALFVAMGAFVGTVGRLLSGYKLIVNLVTGAIVVLFGLNYTGLVKIGFLNGSRRVNKSAQNMNFFSAFLFGIIFAIGWTPCVGAFLGSALMLAAQQGSAMQGILMLLIYSLGLGVPFILSAVLIDKLKGAINFIKSHYRVINIACGILLIIVGILMMTGLMSRLLVLLS